MSFFLNPVMFFSVSAMAFVTELWTAVMCWKIKQGCNKMAIFVCIMQVHFGSLGWFGLLAAFSGYGWFKMVACFSLRSSSGDLVEAISMMIALFEVNILVSWLAKKASRSAGSKVHSNTAFSKSLESSLSKSLRRSSPFFALWNFVMKFEMNFVNWENVKCNICNFCCNWVYVFVWFIYEMESLEIGSNNGFFFVLK